jgi:hypothetical protein
MFMLCCFTSNGFTSFDVTLGSSRVDTPDPGSQTVLSRTSFMHEVYDSDTINNDIALIKLPQMVDFTCKCVSILIKRAVQ